VAEPALEVLQAPQQLRVPIARAEQRDDRVRVRLRDRAAVPVPVPPPLIFVGGAQALVRLGVVPFDPARQGRAEVERQARIVVDDGLDAPLGVVDSRERVGAVALGVDARVPVVQRRRRRLALDRVGARVLARRLLEMAVIVQRYG